MGTREKITAAYYKGKNRLLQKEVNDKRPEPVRDFEKFLLWHTYTQQYTKAVKITMQ